MIEEPGLRAYKLMEAYETFGYRTYTNVRYKGETPLLVFCHEGIPCETKAKDFIIYGMSISSGHIFARIQETMESRFTVSVELADLARDFEWPDGKPCGIIVPSKSIQRRLSTQRGKRLE